MNKKDIYYFNNENFVKVLLVLVALFVLLYFYGLGSVGLIDVDEPRYAEAAREMIESGNWITPFFNYEVRFDKPVLFYWFEAIAMTVFGVNEFSARLPSALSAILCASMLFIFLRTFFSLVVSLLGVLILMSSFEFAALSRFSITDMTLASLISSSIFSFFLGYNQLLNSHRFYKHQVKQFSYWYILGFIFLALAFLTKGPVAIVLLALVFIPFFLWIGSLGYFFRNRSFYIGLLAFCIITVPWYLLVHFDTAGEFTRVFFGVHNFNRYTSVVSGHKGSIFYYIPVILLGFLPWTFFLPQAIKSIFNNGLKSLLGSPKKQVPWFCLWWFLVIFFFFTLSQTKLLTYVLSVFPALSGVMAFWFSEIFNKKVDKKGLVIGLGVFFVFLLVFLYIGLFHLDVMLPREIKTLKLDLVLLSFVFLLFVGISMAWASSHRNERTTLVFLLSTFLMLYVGFVTFLLPKVDKHSQLMLRTFAKTMPSDVEIATYKIQKPSLTFYSKRPVNKFNSIRKLQKRLHKDDKFAFVTKKKLLDGGLLDDAYKWGEDSRYVFFTNYKS